MIQKQYIYLLLLVSCLSFGQTKKFDKTIQNNIKNSVPTIKVGDIENPEDYIFLDARELKEYNTSHIQNAVFVGFDHFDINQAKTEIPQQKKPIVVYCSIGVRSEMIGEKLIEAGYTEVYNLYGGVFEWKNQSKEVYNSENHATEEVHTFSKEWSKWLTNGTKIYEE